MTDIVTRWWLMRHAPVIGADGRLYGQDDLDCDCSDTALFAAVARQLPAEPIWLVTPLRRTQATLAALRRAGVAAPLGDALSAETEPGLLEQHFGAWQGRSYAELEAQDGEAYRRFWQAPADQAPPQGESFRDVIGRVRQALRDRSSLHAGRDIVAVSHGGAIRAALAAMLDLVPARALSFVIEPCSLTRFDQIRAADGAISWRILGVNQVPQLHPDS
ncbi:MAG TPA: histidine phosphatase family protein [Dongiaceae bacterium]|nr:histidine phosphatase family protein [Dongiaceae bacterium]